MEFGIFCFKAFYLFFGNGGAAFHRIFSPAVRFSPDFQSGAATTIGFIDQG
jgi:hypothetical protein